MELNRNITQDLANYTTMTWQAGSSVASAVERGGVTVLFTLDDP